MGESGKSNGQSSLEYLLVVALTFAIIVPATYLFYNYSKESNEQIIDSQITSIGRSIVDTAESISNSGKGSKTVLELNIPDKIDNAKIIDGRELVFSVRTGFGVSETVFFSSVTLTTASCSSGVCQLPELSSQGLKKIKLTAETTDSVSIK